MLEEHLRGYVVRRDRQLCEGVTGKDDESDLVVLHVVNELAEHLFGSVETRGCDILREHGVGDIEGNHDLYALTFLHAFGLSVLRTGGGDDETCEGEHEDAELEVYACRLGVGHEGRDKLGVTELACLAALATADEDVGCGHRGDEEQEPQEFYICKSKHRVSY